MVATLWACETTKPSIVKRTPLQRAIIQGQRNVTEGIVEGIEESEDLDQFRFQVRHNPGRCEAPVYEVFLKGRWTRAYFNLERPEFQAQLDLLAQQTDVLAVLWVKGKMTEAVKLSAKRVAWPLVDIIAVENNTLTAPKKPATSFRRHPCVGATARVDHLAPRHIVG